VAKDITEKKNLEVLLGKSNRLAVVGSWEIDVIKGTVFWSDITKEIREVDPDFVPDLSIGISYFKEGESRETISNLVAECIENGTPWDEELQILTHKGNLKWIRTIGEAEIINGKCIRVFGSFQDIDEKKKALIKLAESENRFRTILEAEPEWVKLLGPSNELLMMNPAGLAMIEADNEAQVVGKSVLGIVLPEHRAAFSELAKNVFEGTSGKLVYEIQGFKGTRRWMETHAVPLKNELGNIISLLGVTRDITERNEYENSLKQLNETLALNAKELALSNKELEQFAFVASHDLQEPLRMVTSFLNQLEKKYGDTIDDKGKQYIHFAVDGANRMRQIILDLLEFSKVGRFEDQAEQVNSSEMVEDVISLYTMQIEQSNASIELGELPTIKTHKTPFFQVFHNLIGNALKYRHPEKAPLIKISCTEIPGYWKFSIKDNGIGIDEQYFEKIFVIFQRLHNKNEYNGTGIGLAIVKKIIHSLDGKIWVESEEGKGTVFYFTLPKESAIKK
jgi:PAS domain S-box-containing protein